jgi:2'-5' RNA ligase
MSHSLQAINEPAPPKCHQYQEVKTRHNSRQEPYAVVPHVRICAGGAGKPAFLPRLNEVKEKSFPIFPVKMSYCSRTCKGEKRCREERDWMSLVRCIM